MDNQQISQWTDLYHQAPPLTRTLITWLLRTALLMNKFKTLPLRTKILTILSTITFCLCGLCSIPVGIGAMLPASSPTITFTSTITRTPTLTYTITISPTTTSTHTATLIPTTTLTPTITITPTITLTRTATLIPSATIRPSDTRWPTATNSPFTPKPPSGSGCDCSRDYDCKDFSTQRQAQSCFNSCGGSTTYNWSRLDGSDRDGRVCESLP